MYVSHPEWCLSHSRGLGQHCRSSCRSELIYPTLPTLIGLGEKTHSMRMQRKWLWGSNQRASAGGASTYSTIVFPASPKPITVSGTQKKGTRLASCRKWGLVGGTGRRWRFMPGNLPENWPLGLHTAQELEASCFLDAHWLGRTLDLY